MRATSPAAAPSDILSAVLPAERLFLATSLVCLGRFRCDPGDPSFGGGAPCTGHTVVFPRRAVWIQHDGGRPFVADPATIPLYNRGQEYTRKAIDPRGDACEWMAFPSAVVADAMRALGQPGQDRPDRPFDAAALPASGPIYAAQRRMFDAAARGGSDEGALEEQALLLLDAVLRQSAPRPARPASRAVIDGIEEARRLINLERPHARSLTELARACGLTPYRLCREFHRATGMTISAYRTRLRLFDSLDALPRARDLSALALDAGFCSHSHFTAAFRRVFGATPSSLRPGLGQRGFFV